MSDSKDTRSGNGKVGSQKYNHNDDDQPPSNSVAASEPEMETLVTPGAQDYPDRPVVSSMAAQGFFADSE